MKPWPVRAVALIIFIFLVACVPAVTASYCGYSVAPGEADAAQGQPQDPDPISFFDLSLREMLVAVALSFSPVLVYPVELLLLPESVRSPRVPEGRAQCHPVEPEPPGNLCVHSGKPGREVYGP